MLQAIPAITLVLFGGVVADRFSRQRVALVGRGVFAVLCLVLSATAAMGGSVAVMGIYVVALLVGCASAFTNPANQGLEADELPDGDTLRAASVLTSIIQVGMLSGPVAASFMYGIIGASLTYLCLAVIFVLSGLMLIRFVPPRPAMGVNHGDSILARIGEGLRFVKSDQILLGSMALDLFAVFFGGATALLPVFASDILHVGPTGFGILRSAMSVGSLLAMIVAVRHPPSRHAGVAFHAVIAGFGVAIIAFAFSRNFYLSCAVLVLAGMCDGISVVVRRAILRLGAPGAMRGRITAVRMVFVSSSNELGDFESGMLAGAIGAVSAVWVGGVITLGVVAATAFLAPKLLKLDLEKMERDAAQS